MILKQTGLDISTQKYSFWHQLSLNTLCLGNSISNKIQLSLMFCQKEGLDSSRAQNQSEPNLFAVQGNGDLIQPLTAIARNYQ